MKITNHSQSDLHLTAISPYKYVDFNPAYILGCCKAFQIVYRNQVNLVSHDFSHLI